MRLNPSDRIVISLLIALTVIAIGTTAARAQDNQDSGFSGGHKYRIGLGLAPVVNDSKNTAGLGQSGRMSEFLKADETYFRSAHFEDLVSIWYVHGSFNLSGKEVTTTLGAATYEARQRYFGHGIGYTAFGVGAATGDLLTTSAKVAYTSAVGIDIGHVFIEFRSLTFGWANRGIGAFFVGGRF